MGYEFYVNENVLVPRQDTETLVESALECMKNTNSEESGKGPHVLDMCTGSGCILISLLKEMPQAYGTGVDLSEPALEVARRNAQVLEVNDRAEFVKSNLFSAQYFINEESPDTENENNNGNHTIAYDMIISNPPYIPTAEIDGLMDEVKLHDPRDGTGWYGRWSVFLQDDH